MMARYYKVNKPDCNCETSSKTSAESCCSGPAEPSCCSGSVDQPSRPRADAPVVSPVIASQPYWMTGVIETAVGAVPKIATELVSRDKWDNFKARLGFNRMQYKVSPGLYAVGSPDQTSAVLVTANYKMSFDFLRRELAGMNAWILILDTKGINVWCAAGKGNFGTQELVNRIAAGRLQDIVTHRKLILPQLGATGVAAHLVKKQSGFTVVYGPVRAEDLRSWLGADMNATRGMRTVRFNLVDRLIMTPIEFLMALRFSLTILGVLFILNLLGIASIGIVDFYGYMGSLVIGCVLVPALLPWIPGRAFSWKGWLLGLHWAIGVNLLNGWPDTPAFSLARAVAYLLILPAIAAFLAMNFTGSSTYTSFSGIQKEMKYALPAMIVSFLAGAILLLLG